MQKKHIDTVRFEKISLDNYGIFQRSHDFVFNRQRTLIVGGDGTGRTTIMKALSNLGSLQELNSYPQAGSPEVSVNVSTSGNRKLVAKYGNLIFFDSGEFARFGSSVLENTIDDRNQDSIKDEVRSIFEALLQQKPWKIEEHTDLDPSSMAAGELICLGIAYRFAVRKILNLDLPVVFDGFYGSLDLELRNGVSAFLDHQECQQIFLLGESEYKCVFNKEEVHYTLGDA